MLTFALPIAKSKKHQKFIQMLFTCPSNFAPLTGWFIRLSKRFGQIRGYVIKVKKAVSAWLNDDRQNRGAMTVGLTFVQMMKNQAYYSGIKCRPYETIVWNSDKLKDIYILINVRLVKRYRIMQRTDMKK